MKKTYYKLVRDKIPEQILKQNKRCSYFPLTNNCRKEHYLVLKVQEEIKELLNTNNEHHLVEEAADVFEILEAFLKFKNIDINHVLKFKELKKKDKGSFDDFVCLEWVDDDASVL